MTFEQRVAWILRQVFRRKPKPTPAGNLSVERMYRELEPRMRKAFLEGSWKI
jgi:hypothetical protein